MEQKEDKKNIINETLTDMMDFANALKSEDPQDNIKALMDLLQSKTNMVLVFGHTLPNYNYVDSYLQSDVLSLFAMQSLLPTILQETPHNLNFLSAYDLSLYLPTAQVFLLKNENGDEGVIAFKNMEAKPDKEGIKEAVQEDTKKDIKHPVIYDSYVLDENKQPVLRANTNAFLNQAIKTHTGLMYYNVVFYTKTVNQLIYTDFLNASLEVKNLNADLISIYFTQNIKTKDRFHILDLIVYLKNQTDLTWYNQLQQAIKKYDKALQQYNYEGTYFGVDGVFVWMLSYCNFSAHFNYYDYMQRLLMKSALEFEFKNQAEKEWNTKELLVDILSKKEDKASKKLVIDESIKADIKLAIKQEYEKYKAKNETLINELSTNEKVSKKLKLLFKTITTLLDEKIA